MHDSDSPHPEPQPSVPRFWGWRLVIAGAFILAIGGEGAGLPTLARVLLGDTRELIGRSWTAAFYPLLTSVFPLLLLPFIGCAVDRWGPRRMVVWGATLMGIGFALHVAAHMAPLFYLSVMLLVLGSTSGSQLPMMAAVNNWFLRRRATAIAVMMLSSVAAFFVTNLLGVGVAVLANAPAFLLPAAVMLALAWVYSKLVRNRPEDHGQHPDGTPPPADAPAPDYGWREALRTRAFWLMIVGGASATMASSAIDFLQALRMYDLGFSSVELALAASATPGLVAMPFVLVGGLAGDRIPIRWALCFFALLQCIAGGVLAFAGTLPMFYVVAVLMGAGSGGMAPLAFAARGAYFGRRNYATIIGVSLTLANLLALGEPVLVGMAYDATGGFMIPLATVAALGTLGALAQLWMGDPHPSPSQLRAA